MNVSVGRKSKFVAAIEETRLTLSQKTIALGTFPAAEADEKCQRAKALTRAWRSSMRPKPSREWVMVELERLGVRVVSGRLGRKAGDEGDPTPVPGGDRKAAPTATGGIVGGAAPGLGWGTDADLNNLMRRNSLSLMNDAAGRRGSLGSLGQVIGLEADRPMVGMVFLAESWSNPSFVASKLKPRPRESLWWGTWNVC